MEMLRFFCRSLLGWDPWERPTPAATTVRQDGPHVRAAGGGIAGDDRCKCHQAITQGSIRIDINVDAFAGAPEDHPRNWLATGFLATWAQAWNARDWWAMSEVLDDAEEVITSLIHRDAGEGESGLEKGGGI